MLPLNYTFAYKTIATASPIHSFLFLLYIENIWFDAKGWIWDKRSVRQLPFPGIYIKICPKKLEDNTFWLKPLIFQVSKILGTCDWQVFFAAQVCPITLLLLE